MVGNVIVKCELFLASVFEFLLPQKIMKSVHGGHLMILNFSQTLKKSPAHIHMVGNVIVKFE